MVRILVLFFWMRRDFLSWYKDAGMDVCDVYVREEEGEEKVFILLYLHIWGQELLLNTSNAFLSILQVF